MAEYPESVAKIVSNAVSRYRDDCERATEFAKARICLLPEYQELVDGMITDAVRHLVNDKRHNLNVAINRAAGAYSKPTEQADVTALNAAASASVNYFNYFIAGRTLGDLSGAELPELADIEHEKGIGCFRNESILRALAPLVKGDKTVREAVKPKQLEAIFLRVHSAVSELKPTLASATSANGRAAHTAKSIPPLPGRKTKPAMAGH